MSLFVGSTSGQAPLQLQLGSDSASARPAVLVGFTAAGENAAGSAARPSLSRPSTPGDGSGLGIIPYSPSDATSSLELFASFSSAPSLPVSGPLLTNVPFRVTWRASARNGYVLPMNGFLLLYANATGGHTWSGEMVWEEK